ncbi:hypothetical protein AABB24_024635 [Solanum stoloniferum]|uniref:AT-hook motif nuclear-localized protein n=1 Tax=Solanum stoloniferum TaxID=62892 RepID=A0ABD2SPK0_9SOLN
MENVGSPSPSAADDDTPVQPISSSTPPVPSFPAPLGTTGVPPVSPTETRKRGRPEKHATESSASPVMTTPSPSQVAGGGFTSPTQPQADVASPGMTTPLPSQVAGGGLSSPTQPQEDGASPGMTTPPPPQVAGGGLSSPTQPQAEAAISAVPVKRGRGRPPGSKSKQKSVGSGSKPAESGPMQSHVIKIETGEDVLAKIMSFCKSTSNSVCVLSGNGSISKVLLRQTSGIETYEGLFQIINLSGFIFVLESGSTEGGLSVLLGGEADGYIRGGSVAGLLTAATAVQVIVGSFSTQKQRPLKSVGTLSGSSGGPDSPPDETRKKRSSPGVKDQKPWK